MVEPDHHRFDTRALHAGQRPDPVTGSRAVPIHQTTSYVFDSVDHAAGLFNLEVSGHLYSRISNPTVAVLEERLASLEGGVGAVCTSSGQAALHLAMATILHAGDHIVASRNIYGGSHNMLNLTMPRFGITTHRYRLSLEERILQPLYSDEKTVHVHMGNHLSKRLSSWMIDYGSATSVPPDRRASISHKRRIFKEKQREVFINRCSDWW